MKEAAEEGRITEPCFWTRGLVPKAWTRTETPRGIRLRLGGDKWEGGTYFLDGSGGENTSDPRLRRCGWAAVKLKEGEGTDFEQVICGSLPGEKQTVPRAELMAAISVLEEMRGKAGHLLMYTDCKYVHKGAIQGKGKRGMKNNLDLWDRFWELKDEREREGYEVRIEKVKAHGELCHIYMGILTMEQFKGNALADAFAKEAAKLEEATREEIKRVQGVDNLAWKVQSRIMEANIRAIGLEELA